MSSPSYPPGFRLNCTRSIFVLPAEGVTAEALTAALNARLVRLDEQKLIHVQSGALLGTVVDSGNRPDYRLAGEADQCPLPELDQIDIYDYGFNKI